MSINGDNILSPSMTTPCIYRCWSGIVVIARRLRSTKLINVVSTEVGDRIQVQFPVWDIYLGMWPATQVNSAWPSLRG